MKHKYFYSIPSLTWILALHLLLLSQEKPLRWKEINTNTHTHTHTHTYTHTHIPTCTHKHATVRFNGFPLMLYQYLSQCCIDKKIRKAFSSKSKPSWCSVGSKILPLYWVRTALEFSLEEGKNTSRFFTVGFLGSH